MLIRILLVASYILHCIRLRVGPWKYFQLNAPYFNDQRNLFSKLDMDQRIPKQWRLEQFMDFGQRDPDSYPVFVKPEWGQNSQGIIRADNLQQLNSHRQARTTRHPFYLIQSAAPGKREFEIFVIAQSENIEQVALFSITETCNSGDDPLPINGIYNQTSYYQDLAGQLSKEQQTKIWSHLKRCGQFRIARYGVRADSLASLIAGHFHIIEINLFVPMPLLLLVEELQTWQKIKFVLTAMQQLAAVTKTIPATQTVKAVFFKKLKCAHLLKAITKSEITL